MAVLVTLFGVVLGIVVVLVAGLLRGHAEILRVLHEQGLDLDPHQSADPADPAGDPGLPVPGPRPEARPVVDIVGVTVHGDAASIAIAGTAHHTLLAFLTTGCTTCAQFWTAFSDGRALRVPGDARLVVVTKGAEAESPARLRRFATGDVPVVLSSEAWESYDVPVAPYFAYVDGPSASIIGEGAASTWEHLVQMMEQALADAGMPVGGRRRRSRAESSRARERRVDQALFGAGIGPGHPSLYPQGPDGLNPAALNPVDPNPAEEHTDEWHR